MEGLTFRGMESGTLELSKNQKDYLGELTVSEQDWNSLSTEKQSNLINALNSRMDELSETTAIRKEDIISHELPSWLATEVRQLEKTDFLKQVKELDEEIKKMPCEKEGAKVILDGIINPERYFDAKERIIALVKDPYDSEGTDLGGWSLPESLNAKESLAEQSSNGLPTFRPLVAIANQINDNKTYSEIKPDLMSKEAYDTYKSCSGHINVGKELILDSTYSSEKRTAKLAIENRDIIEKQIKIYDPTVVIGGGTLHHFVEDKGENFSILGEIIPKENFREFGRTKVYFNENRVFIDTYHPSRRPITMKDEAYCDQIADIVKKWRNNTL